MVAKKVEALTCILSAGLQNKNLKPLKLQEFP